MQNLTTFNTHHHHYRCCGVAALYHRREVWGEKCQGQQMTELISATMKRFASSPNSIFIFP
jgi:hypothetical protein